MQPILDIRAVHENLFTYSLGAGAMPARDCENLFETIEACLRDAAMALYLYFDHVEICFAGLALGSYPVYRLVQDAPGSLAERIAHQLAGYMRRERPNSA